MKRSITLILVLIPLILISQPKLIKKGKIPIEDLKMAVYDPDTAASAVVLGDYGAISFSGGQRIYFSHGRLISVHP